MSLSLPVRVQGHDPDGKAWAEMSNSADTSFGGASIPVKHALEVGQVLLLSLPLPKSFRSYDLTEQSYRVYALVRDINPMEQGLRVGVLFLGKHPPKGYDKNPGGRYLLATDQPPPHKDRRLSPRYEVFVNLKLHRTDSAGTGPREERTVAENLGKRGARVPTSLPVSKGEILLVEELEGSFRTRAEVRNVFIGPDQVPRLNLKFLDAEAPDRLVSK